MQVSNVSREQN